MTSFPRGISNKRATLGSDVADGKLSADDAGHALASFIENTYPDIYRAIVDSWCIARFRRYNTLPVGWTQASLFPATKWYAPLAEAVKYAEAQRGITGRFSSRDALRSAELDQLIAAAGGDLTMSLADAYALAFPCLDGLEEEIG